MARSRTGSCFSGTRHTVTDGWKQGARRYIGRWGDREIGRGEMGRLEQWAVGSGLETGNWKLETGNWMLNACPE
jgi:hypothetical protein